MEGLAPPLKCLIEIQAAIQNGEPIQKGLQAYLRAAETSDPFKSQLQRFLFAWDQGQDWRAVLLQTKSVYRRALLEVIATGLAGQPIQNHLDELRSELLEACDVEIKRHLELLPILMLGPLLLFQFPAFLLLLFGPLLTRLLHELAK